MAQGIDHIVIAVHDLAAASADYARAGFTVTAGGEHADGATHNALVTFADGSYLELIAFKEPRRPQEHRWWAKQAKGEGLVDFALRADRVDDEAARLRDAGLVIEEPRDGGRTRPDGVQIAWRNLILEKNGLALPFLIEDRTPRDRRVPAGSAAEHPLRVTGIAGVTVLVSNVMTSERVFGALLGRGEEITRDDLPGAGAARRYQIGDAWIDIVQPDSPSSDLGRYAQSWWDGPYEIVLAGAGGEPGDVRLLPLDLTHGARIRLGD